MISRDDRAIPLNDFIGKDMFRDTAFTAYSVSTAKLHIEPSIVKENEWPFRAARKSGREIWRQRVRLLYRARQWFNDSFH